MVKKTPIKRIGTPAQVYHETALMTPGGVKKSGLVRVRQSDGTYRIRFKAMRDIALKRWNSSPSLRASFAPHTKKKTSTKRV